MSSDYVVDVLKDSFEWGDASINAFIDINNNPTAKKLLAPESIRTNINNLLLSLEEQNGLVYEINIIPVGYADNFIQKFGTPKSREPYVDIEVYDAIDECESLNGIYENMEQLEMKIKKLIRELNVYGLRARCGVLLVGMYTYNPKGKYRYVPKSNH